MDIQEQDSFGLLGVDQISVILGKNGCGKSTLLKKVEEFISARGGDGWGIARYITPERGGALVHDAGTEQTATSSPTWIRDSRRSNQFGQFRQQTILQYRRLELAVLREYAARTKDGETGVPDFDRIIESINSLLDNIEISPADTAFAIYRKPSGELLAPDAISSGESELVSLAIECMVFAREIEEGKENLLCLDEPDVHLHPDLQNRFMTFLKGLVEEYGFRILIATHSTAILGALADSNGAAIGLMKSGDTEVPFHPIDEVYRKVLPVFGAHPLSNIFNEAPVLLVEGEDDVRIWQQAVRSSAGTLQVHPVDCGSVEEMHEYEEQVKSIIDAVYDEAVAYSLRDRDGTAGEIDDLSPVIRMKLGCRAAENLLLTNEVLDDVGISWEDTIESLDEWIERYPNHPKRAAMNQFKAGGYDRKSADLKELRMVIVGVIFASTKPWEVLVGTSLSRSSVGPGTDFSGEGSIFNFLGEKAAARLLPAA